MEPVREEVRVLREQVEAQAKRLGEVERGEAAPEVLRRLDALEAQRVPPPSGASGAAGGGGPARADER
eukprot:3630619-Prorocentrum_lima.AAC.1